jgi:hypothetical protein
MKVEVTNQAERITQVKNQANTIGKKCKAQGETLA